MLCVQWGMAWVHEVRAKKKQKDAWVDQEGIQIIISWKFLPGIKLLTSSCSVHGSK